MELRDCFSLITQEKCVAPTELLKNLLLYCYKDNTPTELKKSITK